MLLVIYQGNVLSAPIVIISDNFVTGYASLVTFSDRSYVSVVGSTHEMCENNRENVIEIYTNDPHDLTVDESNSTPCGPRSDTFSRLALQAWKDIGVGTRCLSCPLLGQQSFKTFYPNNFVEIEQLFYQYRINEYNKQLNQLQKKFNLNGFEKDVFLLNKSIIEGKNK